MGILWTLAPIRGAALVEFGCMGHMRYADAQLSRIGISDGCRLYSTHIDETDIALGSTDRVERAVADIIKRDNPRAVFLQPSSVPQVVGTDLTALAEELQALYPGTTILPFDFGGFDHTQHRGVQDALQFLVESLPVEREKSSDITFNIIGSCPDLYRFKADADEIVRIMAGAFGIRPGCILSSDTSIAEIEKMGSAHINLVVRREGIPAAKHLEERFGTPYLFDRPYGVTGTVRWIEKIGEIMGKMPDNSFLNTERAEAASSRSVGIFRKFSSPRKLSLGGHADVVQGILSFGCNEMGLQKGTCWCDCPDMASDEIPCLSEEQWVQAVRSHKDGILMASGEALALAEYGPQWQISNPATRRQREPLSVQPLVGFRGAKHLTDLWREGNAVESLMPEKRRRGARY